MKMLGTKVEHIKTLVNHIPPHRVYIELFLGSGLLLRRKAPAEVNIGVDLDERCIKEVAKLVAQGNYRLKRADAIDFVRGYRFQGDEFIYADPPYLHSARSNKKIYRYEVEYDYHFRLLGELLKVDAKIMLAGYSSLLYRHCLTGWRCLKLNRKCGAVSKERIWMNYPATQELHDYRYIGENFRQREAYLRRQRSMQQRYTRMTITEKNAFLAWVKKNEGTTHVR